VQSGPPLCKASVIIETGMPKRVPSTNPRWISLRACTIAAAPPVGGVSLVLVKYHAPRPVALDCAITSAGDVGR
jgi:hypothetical protein